MALIIRTGCWGILCYDYNKEHQIVIVICWAPRLCRLTPNLFHPPTPRCRHPLGPRFEFQVVYFSGVTLNPKPQTQQIGAFGVAGSLLLKVSVPRLENAAASQLFHDELRRKLVRHLTGELDIFGRMNSRVKAFYLGHLQLAYLNQC